MSIFWLRVAVVLYAVGLLHVIVTVLRRQSSWFRPALGAFTIAVVLHTVSLTEAWFELGVFPVNNFFESMSVCAYLIAVFFLFAYWRYNFGSLAMFLFPLVFLMAMLGSTEVPVQSWSNEGVRGAWLLTHVALVLLGYAALVLTAGASIFYLIQERRLKAKTVTSLFEKLPPLGTLDNIINRSMGLGFVLLTLATVTGMTWAFIESGTRWIGDPKIAISMLTWWLCLVMVFLRTSAGWRGRKAALMSLTVVGSSALTWAAHIGLRPELLVK
jgi:ABC-type uncharacterized transport system permease subunit